MLYSLSTDQNALSKEVLTNGTSTHSLFWPQAAWGQRGPEKIFEEIIAENFPNMGKEIVNQVQEAQRVTGRINQGGTHQDI